VVTQPDRPRGRSRSTLVPSAVKRVAVEEKLPVLHPERPRGPEFLDAVRALAPELSVVVAYGHLLTQEVIDLPTRGTINIHASLLPALRGAAPIQAAIRQGLTETGVTIMRMVLALDAGPILHQVKTPIPVDETYGELQLRLSELGALALIEALALLQTGMLGEQPQDDAQATYAGKVTREVARIDWTARALEVCRMIRAYDPRPGAWTLYRGAEVKLFGPRLLESRQGVPGEIVEIGSDGAVVAAGDGAVRIAWVHPAGRRRMTPVEWQAGRGLAVGDRLGS
jgi:methionyl-tRNA formyltransferase